MLYYVSLFGGQCGLIAAKSITQAKANACHDEGHSNVIGVRKATEKDIEWVRAMGGRVPDEEA
jgi:hypothetical protein